jgi:uncharacterized membrane-anchored protein
VLGRDGFEKLTWVGPKSAMGSDMLKVAQSSFSFPIGGHYTDFKAGDRVAEYGIASLVAAVLGAKVTAKVGLIVLLAAFAKKAGALIILPFLLVFGWIKRLTSRKNTLLQESVANDETAKHNIQLEREANALTLWKRKGL